MSVIRRRHIYLLLVKLIVAFAIIYVIPFATVIVLMVKGFLPMQTGVSVLLTIVLLYLTAFQVEIALRNSAFRELEVQPILRVRLEEKRSSDLMGYCIVKEVVLKNEGKHPAKAVAIDIDTDSVTRIDEKYKGETFRDMLVPGEGFTVMHYDDILRSREIQINVIYTDVMERERFVMFVKPRNYELFIPIGAPVNLERGIFIKTLERLSFVKSYLKLKRVRAFIK